MHAYLILILLLSSNSILISFHNGSDGYSTIVMPVFLHSPTYAGNCQFRKLTSKYIIIHQPHPYCSNKISNNHHSAVSIPVHPQPSYILPSFQTLIQEPKKECVCKFPSRMQISNYAGGLIANFQGTFKISPI
jgi:hypothetical protein